MRPRRPLRDFDVTVITGLSGAGRSEAAKALEDLGWFVVDNLPPSLIKTMVSLAIAPGNDLKRIAVVLDVRGGTFFTEAHTELAKLRRDVCNYRLLFLEADDDALVRRFEASRRLHPLAPSDPLITGIQRERELMRPWREGADLVIDSSELSVRDLRTRIGAYFEGAEVGEDLKTTIISFGYKFGLPLDADMVLDVRFLPNPHWVDSLRPLTGLDARVIDYVMEQEATPEFLENTRRLLASLLPRYRKEGRHYLTIAIGCTGGRHRSVVLGEVIRGFIENEGFTAKVLHRDVERTR